MALKKLGSLLPHVLIRHRLEKGVEAAQVIAAIEEEIVRRWGGEGARAIRVRFFKNGAVVVSCSSSVWAQEIKLREKEILQLVREKIGSRILVERVRFVV